MHIENAICVKKEYVGVMEKINTSYLRINNILSLGSFSNNP